MGHSFSQLAKVVADESSMRETLARLVDSRSLYVAGEPVSAMAALLIYPHYFNLSQIHAQELFWWVDESARGTGVGRRLLRAIEDAARDAGAHSLTMVSLAANPVDKLYEAAGYALQESSFVKVL
jgi:GNAT superfamily N-acetyltransferase